MEYKHRHLLSQLSKHRDMFRRVGELIRDNRKALLADWRREFKAHFGGLLDTDRDIGNRAEVALEHMVDTLLDWEPRKHLDGTRRLGEILASKGVALDDVAMGYHMLQETIRSLIRKNVEGELIQLWEAMEDFHGHSLAVLMSAYHEVWERERRNEAIFRSEDFISQLEMAKSIQGNLIPAQFQNHYLKAISRLQSMDVIGGDLFYTHRINDHLAFFAIADAEGHGLPAALNMMALSAHFQTVLSNYYTPEYVAEYMNRVIIRGESGMPPTSGIFITIDGSKEEMRIVNAGHPNPIIIREADGSVEQIEHGNLVLGISKKEEYVSKNYKFNSGDRLILFTDGLIDFKGTDGDFMGTHGVQSFLERNRHLNGEELLDKLMERLRREERSGGERTDDILVVAIEARRSKWVSILIPRVSFERAKGQIINELRALELPHDTISDIHVVIDELLDNALCHGNAMDPELPIQIEYLATPDEFRIRVTDSGEGFDWHSIDAFMDKEKILTSSGRGLYFIRSLMDEVTFNEKGNQITAVTRFDRN